MTELVIFFFFCARHAENTHVTAAQHHIMSLHAYEAVLCSETETDAPCLPLSMPCFSARLLWLRMDLYTSSVMTLPTSSQANLHLAIKASMCLNSSSTPGMVRHTLPRELSSQKRAFQSLQKLSAAKSQQSTVPRCTDNQLGNDAQDMELITACKLIGSHCSAARYKSTVSKQALTKACKLTAATRQGKHRQQESSCRDSGYIRNCMTCTSRLRTYR